MNATQKANIEKHGLQLLAIFPNATDRDPVSLCKRLRRIEREAARFALRGCNGPEWESEEAQDKERQRILGKANKLLGNVRDYQPKTGAACSCRRGVQRDNCPTCEGTGHVIDFAAIRSAAPIIPIFLNGDPRGYSLKIEDDYTRKHNLDIHRDWGGYGIIAPEIND